jgi:Secretion system C-terminal sorting domain
MYFPIHKYVCTLFLAGAGTFAQAQVATATKFYTIVQQKCVSCHNATSAQGGLNLAGTQAVMYAALYNKTPNNAAAAARGDKLIYPGRPDRSFLYRKLNGVFDSYAKPLAANEGALMPSYGAPTGSQFTVEEKELLRQWVNYAAPNAGAVVSEQMIYDYYNVNGKASFPVPPAPPLASEGFQMRIGPFLMAPGTEAEFYQKLELNLPANVEVTRIESIMSNYSHHLITYKYNTAAAANATQHGLRMQANYTNTTLQTAVQEATDLRLPQGSAFFWNATTAIDMDSHYINYSNTQTYLAEAYINVYTQAAGTAQQEMKTLLVPNTSISIPADQNPHTFSQNVNYNIGNVYMWGLMGHTHKYGTDYKIYKRNVNGTRGTMLYDGQCSDGVPNCFNPYFDYKHIPLRYFMPFETINMTNGFIHDATYLNTGTTAVGWGETSNDEMMVVIAMYLSNTTGVIQGTGSIEPIDLGEIRTAPNPAHDRVLLTFPPDLGEIQVNLYDVYGREVFQTKTTNPQLLLETADFARGIYMYRATDKTGRTRSGKLVFQ